MGAAGGVFGAIGGSMFNVAGEIASSSAEAAAQDANGDWLMEQAEFARQSTVRELKIYDIDSGEAYGDQVSGIARGGLDLSGSPLLVLADTKMRQYEERQAIKAQGDIQYREATLKAQDSYRSARATRDMGTMSAIGSAFGGAAAAGGQIYGASSGISSRKKAGSW